MSGLKIAIIFIGLIGGADLCAWGQAFITTWKTDNPGTSASNQITIPGTGSNYTINWEEVGNPANNGNATGNGATTVTFPSAGTYRVSILPGAGTFTAFRFAFGGDRLKLTGIEQWGSIAWSTMQAAFMGCENLAVYNATDIPNLSSATSLVNMFTNCTQFNGAIGNWNVSTITNMHQMFSFASAFNQPIGNWNVGNVTNMASMFGNATAFNQPLANWDVSKVTNMSFMFQAAQAFNQPIDNWNVSNVTNMSVMFNNAKAFNQPIGNWNVGNVTNMSEMFRDATSFNQPIGNWNVGKVTDMSRMFFGATAFNQPIGNWNVSNVTDMNLMFNIATAFNQPIGDWNVSKVTDMNQMFRRATAFNQPIGDWNVGKVANMSFMFDQATAFNHPIGTWDVSNVTNMVAMFFAASSFNQNLGSWTLNSGVNMSSMLVNNGMNCINYSATLNGWAANPATPNGRNLGATGRSYGTNALDARNALLAKGWTISGDNATGTVCLNCPVTVAQVQLAASQTSIAQPTNITFTATPTGGGTAPSFDFKVNNTSVQNGPANTLTRLMNANDKVVCVMTSNEPCVEQKTVTSNEITITDALLPVTLLRFTGRGTPAGNLLEWTTGMEENSKEFVVERSADGTHFEGIARLNAAGSSQVQTHYSLLDAKSGIGKYYYRLKMSDLDGRFKYSGMVLIENGPGIVNTTLAPNPTKSGQSSLLTILGMQPDSRGIVSVINAGGATLKSYQLRQVNGTAQVALSADNLPSGLYIILIRDESGKVNETIRWNVIR